MERKHKQTPALATLAFASAWLSSTAEAQDGLGDARAIKPVLMLVVDTSGSMERMENGTSLPSCPVDLSGKKNRWTGALEALTGSFPSYECVSENRSTYANTEYDYGYYLPHIAPKPAVLAAQATDGVLDVLQTSAKFGVMTFDGQQTYAGGDPLIDYATLLSNPASIRSNVGDSTRDAATGAGALYSGSASGMYSYGPMRRLSFPGCPSDYGVNLGVRGPAAPIGGLVSVGTSDDGVDVRTRNLLVQNTLLNVRPYGGTPIAAALDDLKYWLNNSPDLQLVPAVGTSPASGDLFEKCRQKYAVLLTDGAPDKMFRDGHYKCNSEDYAPNSTEWADLPPLDGVKDTTKEVCAQARAEDGTPIAGAVSCECPYQTETKAAADLVAALDINSKRHDKLDKLYVVAFNVDEATAASTLDPIAAFGDPASVSTSPTKAARVKTAAELRSALNSIFTSINPKATSRTVPITVDGNTGSFSLATKNFEVRAGFRASAVPELPWHGILERSEISCTGTAINYSDENDVLGANDKFHVALNAQSAADQRNVYTIKGASSSLALGSARGTLKGAHISDLDSSLPPSFTYSSTAYDGTSPTAPTADATFSASQAAIETSVKTAPFTNSDTVDKAFFGDADGVAGAGRVEDRERVVNYLHGKAFVGHALADIVHSNPVALGPLVTSGVSARLSAWRSLLLGTTGAAGYAEEQSRPKVVFVGTNDGLLHAFNLDTWGPSGSQKPAGHEFWSFFPPALFDKVHSSAATTPQHQTMFDGDIVVKDMFVNPGNAINPTSPLLATRTILLAAVRGAPAYVALDVTNPELEPGFLWQFSDASMGNTIAKPALAQVSISWNGTVQERAMAILPGGEGEAKLTGAGEDCDGTTGSGAARGVAKATAPSNARLNGRCWRNRGRSLYVVDVATGTVVQKFDGRHFSAPLTGAVAIDEARPLTQAAYMTDDDGVLWYLALDSTDASKWTVKPLWDLFHGASWRVGRTSPHPPLVTRDRTGNDVVIVGTGDVDSLTDNVAHRVVSLTVHREAVSIAGTTTITTTVQDTDKVLNQANWEIQLEAGEAVTGPLSLLEGTVYFSTFKGSATGNACDLGTSSIWGADYRLKDSVGTLPQGKLDIDDGTTVTLGLKKSTGKNEVVLGLNVGKDPLCLTGNTQYNAITNQSGFVATGGPSSTSFHIRANVGSLSGGPGVAGGSDLLGFNREVKVARRSRVVGWAGSVE